MDLERARVHFVEDHVFELLVIDWTGENSRLEVFAGETTD